MNKLRILNSGKEADKLIERATKEAEKLKGIRLLNLKKKAINLNKILIMKLRKRKKKFKTLKILLRVEKIV